jgi:NTE family protein
MSKRINLALQGGGAHGAYTWGVLETILADDDVEIAAISGTSAGALNAAAVKSGMVLDGRQGALDKLAWLWGQVGAITEPGMGDWLSSLAPSAHYWAKAMEMSPAYMAFDMASRLSSPYVWGALADNPLRSIVAQFSYDKVCATAGPDIHICATNVRSGKVRVFTGDEINEDVLLASACLPTLFKAVEFTDPKTGETEAFWDGGYTGNPALFPLFEANLPDDILIVNINPLHREEIPTQSQSIANRINEISFNSSLFRELRAIEFVRRLLREGQLKPGSMKNVLVHMISDDGLMNDLNVATKTIPSPVVIARLREAGQSSAKAFLHAHKGDLNQKSTVNLTEMFN